VDGKGVQERLGGFGEWWELLSGFRETLPRRRATCCTSSKLI
jgi:hypothetical protein